MKITGDETAPPIASAPGDIGTRGRILVRARPDWGFTFDADFVKMSASRN